MNNDSFEQAEMQYMTIVYLLEQNTKEARSEMMALPISILVRSNWHAVGQPHEPAEYQLIISAGGPALRIRGTLANGIAHTAQLEYSNWLMLWTTYPDADNRMLLAFAKLFHYGM